MWDPMTIDEYARLERANGESVVLSDAVWWRRVRPFFYQPLFPFVELAPGSRRPPPGARIGGFQHLVPAGAPANSTRNFLVWDDVRGYSMETLGSKKRGTIRKGMKYFTVRRVEDRDEFIRQGHEVYRSFYERTGYSYRNERLAPEAFARWAADLYSFPQVRVMGAYRGPELCAVEISYLVQDVLMVATLFSRTDCLRFQVVDALTHDLRTRAAEARADIRYIYKGLLSGKPGLDASKLRRGCTVLTRPAWFRVNPLAQLFLASFMPGSYHKLRGLSDIESYSRMAIEESSGRAPVPA